MERGGSTNQVFNPEDVGLLLLIHGLVNKQIVNRLRRVEYWDK